LDDDLRCAQAECTRPHGTRWWNEVQPRARCRRRRLNRASPMSEIKLGPVERIFVAVNRAFGAACVVGGIWLLGTCALALIRGRSFGDAWLVGAIGFGLGIAGCAYLRAPLTRWHKK